MCYNISRKSDTIKTEMNDLLLFAKAISDPIRLRILYALREGELCVCELADALELRQSTLSTHLQIIRQAGLVQTRREGRWVYYALDPATRPLLDELFAAYRASLEADRRLKRDAERIQQRLAMRECGCCVLGFYQLDRRGGEER